MINRLRPLRALFPLNLVSTLTLLISAVLLFTYEHEDHILFVALWLINGVIAVTTSLVLIEAWYVRRWSLSLPPLRAQELEVAQEALSGLKVPLLGPTALVHRQVRWRRPEVHQQELISTSAGLEELVSIRRRGRISEVERTLSVEDIFGFCKVSWVWRQPAELTVLPRSVSISATPLQQLQEGEELYDPDGHPDGDLVELRRYQEGDPLKLVMWRLYARSGQLMVRSPERALSLKKDLVAYVLAHPSDEPSASTVRAYLERGLFGERFELFADGCSGSAESPSEVLDHLLASADGDLLDALPQLLSIPSQRQRGCVVFCSAATPLDQLLSVSRALSAPPLFVLSFPELYEPPPSSTLLKYLLKEERPLLWEGDLDVRQLEATYHALLHEGARVVLISQPEGRLISEFELHNMVESA